MDDIYRGLLAQIELFEEFYTLNRNEIKKVELIKKCLKELIIIYDNEIKNKSYAISTINSFISHL